MVEVKDLFFTLTMFSSLASLLPSALHINSNADLPKQTVIPEETNHEDEEGAYGVHTIQPQTTTDQDQQNPVKGKEKDVKSPSEVCRFFCGWHNQSGMYTRIWGIGRSRRHL